MAICSTSSSIFHPLIGRFQITGPIHYLYAEAPNEQANLFNHKRNTRFFQTKLYHIFALIFLKIRFQKLTTQKISICMVSLARFITGPPSPNLPDRFIRCHILFIKLLKFLLNGFNNLIGNDKQTTPINFNAKD